MESAIFGLVGVFLGSFLTGIKEWLFKHRANRKDREYLAILVTFSLEKLASQCVEIANDDGLFQGQYDSDGRRSFQVPTPNFHPDVIKVEWKSIPAPLMYEIFNIVNDLDAASQRINDILEHVAGPPDYEEAFEERQFSYAGIGIQALKLAYRLRKLGQLPQKEHLDWDPLQALSKQQDEVQKSKAQRNKQQEELMKRMLA